MALPPGSFSAEVVSLGRCSNALLCDGEHGRKGNGREDGRWSFLTRFFSVFSLFLLSLKGFEGLSATVCNEAASSCQSEAA